MHIEIHAISETDLNTADAILQAAFQRPGSWLKELGIIYQLQPAGAFLAHERESTAGVVFSLMYPDYAYIGPLGVRPDFRRQGIGSLLMERVLEWLDWQGVRRVSLDASPIGQSIYEKLGFSPFDRVNIYQRPGGVPASQPPSEAEQLSLQNLDLITATDTQAFGTDRSKLLGALLEIYPQRGFFLKDARGNIKGYLIAQERSIGPWVAKKKIDAELLLKAAMSLSFGNRPVTIIVPEENSGAAALLQNAGFEKVRALRHMVLGSKKPAGQRDIVYGQTSPSLG
jgi:ribosomal protein S18 acetylase RimI-like enzyme